MAVILVPNFGGELILRFARHVPVITLQPVDPGHEIVTLVRWERQHAVLQFSHTHRGFILPPENPDFKPGQSIPLLNP